MINFGIDLGTTNSAIAKFDKGRIEIFRNPTGQKDTLPSVVAFKRDRIIVGDKAKEYLSKKPEDVFGGFKRKMGTSEHYTLSTNEEGVTPVDLSAYVLKELKRFIQSGESLEAAVVTIPASFDTVQSNATKKAGILAGFKQVELLQEPIAASLAYANRDKTDAFEEGKWLVYDLGGGTFDVALIHIQDGEMKVLDHEGNNFLGGTDFDQAIVEKIIIPYMEKTGQFSDLNHQMKSASGKYNQLYYKLLHKAEEAKVHLSGARIAEIEFDTTDDEGNLFEGFMLLKRKQLEALIQPSIESTLQMMKQILKRNQLTSSDIKFVLMVGGSTYIPYVREEVERSLEVAVNTSIDPTTAVAVGAAYYAGTKPKKLLEEYITEPVLNDLKVKVAYQKATQDLKEYFTAKFSGEMEDLFYRIIREDGGFDTGLKPLEQQIQEYLPLIEGSFNTFYLNIYDAQNNPLPLDIPVIGITQGRYAVVGQPLPSDICLEIDDVENQRTMLEVIFEKNSVLPLKKTFVKQLTRTLAKDSNDEVLIHILEGPGYALPAANKPIGFISIEGKKLSRDLVKGSDIEITLEMSESRDLKINVYLMMTDQEFEDVFTPEQRHVNLQRLKEDIALLSSSLKYEIEEAEFQANYETAQKLVDLEYQVLDLHDKLELISEDDVTDIKYQIEDEKRNIAREISQLTQDKYIIRIKNKYFQAKRNIEYVIARYEPSEEDKKAYLQVLEQEKEYLASNSTLTIQGAIDRINHLNAQIVWKSPEYLKEVFSDLSEGRHGRFTHPEQARALIDSGKRAIDMGNYNQLRACINRLWDLLPAQVQQSVDFGRGTGIG